MKGGGNARAPAQRSAGSRRAEWAGAAGRAVSAALLGIALFWLSAAAPRAAAQTAPKTDWALHSAVAVQGPRRAALETGPNRVRGLPFLGTNVTAGLEGSYSLGQKRLSVYFSRAEIYYGPDWTLLETRGSSSQSVQGALKGAKSASLRALAGAETRQLSAAEGGGTVIALKKASYTVFVWTQTLDAADLDFAAAFAARFDVFFAAAADDAGISFPAFVDY